MFEKVKGELAAAVAVSGGLLLAAGYLVELAQLKNANLPAQPILSALPTSFFVSAALQSLGAPFLVSITLVAVVLALRPRRSGFPDVRWWAWFGLALAGCARAAALIDIPSIEAWTWRTTVASLGVAAGVVGLAAISGKLVPRLVPNARGVAGRSSIQAVAGTMLVLTVVAASAFRIADAWTVSGPLPYVGIFLSTEDCPPVLDTVSTPFFPPAEGGAKPVGVKRCYVAGFYLDESDKWVFVVRNAQPASPGHFAPGRLLLLPRDGVKLAATANSALDQELESKTN